MVSHWSRLLEVIQCIQKMGVYEVQLRTLNGMQMAHCLAGHALSTVSDSASHAVIRVAASECPMISAAAVDSGYTIPHRRQPVETTQYLRVAHMQRLFRSISPTVSSSVQIRPLSRGSLNELQMVSGIEAAYPNSDALDCGVLNIRSIGINFRDVLNVLGAYPGDPGPPGADCAGVWAANIMELNAGDACFGMAQGSLATAVAANVLLVAPKGTSISFPAAASTPVVFVTVQIAFQQASNTGNACNLMVHAAAGGVGIAAVQLGTALGCTITGTAGGINKRTYVRTL